MPDEFDIECFVVAEELQIAHDVFDGDIGGGFHLDFVGFGKSDIF